MNKKYNVGIVGASGAVGMELVLLLKQRDFPIDRLELFSSKEGLITLGDTYQTKLIEDESFKGLDFVFFATREGIVRRYAPLAQRAGAIIIDKSSFFRMRPDVPLVIPEINIKDLSRHKGIIANPNCTTTIMLMGLYPLHMAFRVKRIIAATYQSVSGAGKKGVGELRSQLKTHGKILVSDPLRVFPHRIAYNCIPAIDEFAYDGYSKEEEKMRLESRKILGLPSLPISATCVRVPVIRAHSIAVTAEFRDVVDIEKARKAISDFPGVELVDEPKKHIYPTPLNSTMKVKCGVGRIRLDTAFDNGLSFWVSGDNLWKGAALNALQIVEYLIKEK